MNYIKKLQLRNQELEAEILTKKDSPLAAGGKEIRIEQQADGNWIGRINKFGKIIEIRDAGPETILQALLTHPGENA